MILEVGLREAMHRWLWVVKINCDENSKRVGEESSGPR